MFSVIIRLHAQSSTSTAPCMEAPFKTGRECLSTRARACVYALHTRARPSEHYTAACPGLLHSIRDIPHSSHTCKKRIGGGGALLGCPPATTPMPMQRHLWARGTSEPFTGQENPPLFAPWEAPCSGNARFPAFPPSPFLRRARVTLFRFGVSPLGEMARDERGREACCSR